MSSVIEKATAAKISDQRRASVDTDPGRSEIHALGLPPLAEFLGPYIEFMRAGDSAGRIIRLIAGCIEQDMDRVTYDLGDRAFMGKHDVGHAADVFVEQSAEHVGFGGFHE